MPDRHGNEYTTEYGKRYERYIGSKAWSAKRAAYWEVFGRSCKAVGCSETEDLHVHHVTYQRLGDEPFSDLIGLCRQHHMKVHDSYDQDRSAGLARATALVAGVPCGSSMYTSEAPCDPRPFPGTPPKNPTKHAERWERALKVHCPHCDQPPGLPCFNKAPTHRAAGVAYATKNPHAARQREGLLNETNEKRMARWRTNQT